MGRAVGFVSSLGGPKASRDSYGRMVVALLRSMVDKLQGLSAPFVIMHAGLTAEEKKRLTDAYEYVEFHKVDLERYRQHGKLNPMYWLLEAYNPKHNLDKAIVLGADMLCTGSTDRIIYQDLGPIACWREKQRACWNTGCTVIQKSLITDEIFEALLAYDDKGQFGHDQACVNGLFAGRIFTLPENVQEFVDESTKPGGCMWLHFIHKPFAEGGLKKNSPAAIALLKSYMRELWWECE